MRSLCWALLLSLSVVFSAGAQETRGNISGTVQDAEGVVPGATVKITSADTGASQQLVTNSRGYFEAPLLQPGNYTITVEMAGFKTMTRTGIVLAVGQQLQVPMTLEVGGVNEQVTVTAVAPLLDTNSVSSGANFDKQLVDSLPMFSNMPIMLTRYAPGVNPNDAQNLVSQGFVDGTTSAAGTAIGNVGANTYTIDGATNNGTQGRIATSPNSDMIQEMRVESSNFDASVGHGTGLQISMMTRAGTNALRGTINYQYWTNSLNSLNAQQQVTFDARAKSEYEKGRSHNVAFTAGGPVIIPRLVDGRGKLFFFANYSHVDDFIPGKNQGTSTIPANQKHLEGDFSDLLLLPNPAQYQIYDPMTARTDPNNANRVIRDPFPGNIIPRNRIFNADGSYKNPLMGLYAKMVPAPNQNFLSPTQAPVNNYYRGGEPDTPVSDLFGGRIDYNHSASDRFFFRGSGLDFLEGVGDWTYQSPDPSFHGFHSIDRSRYTWSFIGNWTHAAGSTVVDVQGAANRFNQVDLNLKMTELSPTSVGLPAYMDNFCQAKGDCLLPVVNLTTANTQNNYQGMSNGSSNGDTATHLQGQVTVTTIKGSHTLRAGTDIRQALRERTGGGNQSGAFTFDRTYTRQASDESQLTPSNIGLVLAAFELGVMSSASIADNSPASFKNHFYSGFVQDSWRWGGNLTMNFGLRFEFEDGVRETQNRMLVGFDETAMLAITQGAEAAYLASGLPSTAGMLPSISVRGGSLYATDPSQDGASWAGQAMWMPRFSAAYKLGAKTVLKGGYGVYYDTLNAADYGGNQLGYNVTTTNQSSVDLGRTFPISMFDPFPVRADGSRFEAPVGDDLGVDTVAGSAYSPDNLNRQHARQQRWRVSVQRELAANLGIEIGYNGSYANDIDISIRQDYLPEQYWNGDNFRNTTSNAFLTANVTNPFRIQNFAALQQTNPTLYQRMAGNAFFTSQTVARNRLLRAFPQINNLTYTNLPLGESKVHSLEILLNRRYSNGLSGTASFSVNRVRSNRTVEEYDREPTLWQGDNAGRPYRFTGGVVYELPLGAGKKYLSDGGWLSAVAGGWQLSGTYEFQPGALLNWGNLFFYGNTEDINSDNPQVALQPDGTVDQTKTWFNTNAGFEKDPAKIPAGFQKRSFPFRIDGVRSYPLQNTNLSVMRNVDLGSRRILQFRVDMQNLFNYQVWGDPNLDPTSTNFGLITTARNSQMRFFTFITRLQF